MNQVNEERFNFRNVITGLVILFISTFVFISQFRFYEPSGTFKQSVGIFFCVGFFTIGAMMVFSSITFKNRMIYLVAPFVVILGTFFVMNFIHLTGIAKIINTYPALQNSKVRLQAKVAQQKVQMSELRRKSDDLEIRYYVQKAKIDFFAGKKLDAVITELKTARDGMQQPEKGAVKAKIEQLIGHLEKMPANVTEEFNELDILLQ